MFILPYFLISYTWAPLGAAEVPVIRRDVASVFCRVHSALGLHRGAAEVSPICSAGPSRCAPSETSPTRTASTRIVAVHADAAPLLLPYSLPGPAGSGPATVSESAFAEQVRSADASPIRPLIACYPSRASL